MEVMRSGEILRRYEFPALLAELAFEIAPVAAEKPGAGTGACRSPIGHGPG